MPEFLYAVVLVVMLLGALLTMAGVHGLGMTLVILSLASTAYLVREKFHDKNSSPTQHSTPSQRLGATSRS